MLAIRMQRTGRKGYASFRVVVQDSQFAPTSGRVVAKLGHHNPHTKETVINKEVAEQYLSNGAQPSPRVVKLFKAEKIKLPNWVEQPDVSKKRSIKNPEKLRKNRPAEEAAPAGDAPAEQSKEEKQENNASSEAEKKPETDKEQPKAEAGKEEEPAEEKVDHKPAEG